jgi:hypothetical protein
VGLGAGIGPGLHLGDETVVTFSPELLLQFDAAAARCSGSSRFATSTSSQIATERRRRELRTDGMVTALIEMSTR